jgi:hypothetical protein
MPRAAEEGATRRTKDDVILKAILDNPKNSKFFSTFGQRKTAKRGLNDGENFFAIFGTGKATKYRRLDSLSIGYTPKEYSNTQNTGIATNPEDADETRYYIQTITDSMGNPASYVVYRDWQNTAWEDGVLEDGTKIVVTGMGKKRRVMFVNESKPIADVTPKKPDGSTNVTVSNAQVYHWLFDGDGPRGIPLLNTSLIWCKMQTLFMKNRVAIMNAIAQFAYDVKVKGGSAGVAVVKDAYGSTLSNSNTNEAKPSVAPGAYNIHNGASEWKAVKQDTGADAAQVDGDMLMNQAGVGAGIFSNFLGVGSSQNYAQSNSMEGPMFKAFSTYVEQLEDMFQTLFRIAGIRVEVNTPELIRKDTPAMLDGFAKLAAVMPGLTGSEEMMRQVLTLFGVDNEELVVKEIKEAADNLPDVPPTAPPAMPNKSDDD